MRLLITVLLSAISLLQPAYAADFKLGFVNTEKIFRDSSLSVKAQKKLEKEFATREQDIQKQVKQARDMQALLEKESLTLPEADRSKKERDLANLNRDIQRTQRELREDFNLRRNEELTAIQDKARKAILDIAKKDDFDLILEAGVVYASGRVDITDKVLKALER